MQKNLMQNLNKEQLDAVMHKDGPLLIVAGAGTGKTTAITQKIAYMIEQGWAASEEILALTFTEKAAGEMEERVDQLLPIGYLDLWISTFHSFAEKILKLHGIEIGLPGDAKLLNEFEQWILINKNLSRFKLDYYRPLGNPTKFINALLSHFSRLKDEDISPDDYLVYAVGLKTNPAGLSMGGKKESRKSKVESRKSKTNFNLDPRIREDDNKGGVEMTPEMVEQEVARINEVANAYQVYQQLLLEEGAMDFGDLINYTLKLFRERPLILEKYRQQFKYVLVDEFQDTNWAQYELVKMLVGKKENLIVVGDDDQSVYRFRGASMSNILQFKKDYPKTEQIILTSNYRSKQNILDLSYEFIKLNNPNRLECQLISHESKVTSLKSKAESGAVLSKKLISPLKEQGEIEVLKANDLGGEVKAVLDKIADLKIKDDEARWDDFAILVRANDHAKEFIAALESADMPYQYLASRGLYVKPVIMDVIAYFKLLDDYHESRALFRILNLPVYNFTHLELVNFNEIARRKTWSLFETLRNADTQHFEPETKKKIHTVLTHISKHTKLVREKPASQLMIAFLNDSGYLKHLSDLPEVESREQLGYLNQFIKRIQVFEAASDDKTVKTFINELEMEIDSGEEGSLPADFDTGPEAIKIMTVHGSKGLEFKYVFIVNLVDKRFPTTERREAIAVPEPLVKEIVPPGDLHLEEERRLFYVAMTRAKQGLYFTWAPDYGGLRMKKPSRFLVEAGLAEEVKVKTSDKSRASEEQIVNLTPAKTVENGEQSIDFALPKYLSYTQLAAFSNCPYQYRFAHILKVPTRGKGVFSFGKTMHNTLQKLFELLAERRGLGQGNLFVGAGEAPNMSPQVELKEVLKLYEESWQDDWFESKAQKEEYRAKGREAIKIFYEKHKDNWPETASIEKGFKYKISIDGTTYSIQGRIDRIDHFAGGLRLVDYKTGSPKEKLSFDEKEQLLIYQLAAPDIFREPVKALTFYYLDDNSEQEFIGTESELEKMKGKIVETIEEIKKGKFPAKPSVLCKYCDFFDICEFRQS